VSLEPNDFLTTLYKHSADHVYIAGGFLVNPAEQYSAFRNVAFFNDYPYALPGFVSGAFCLSTAIASFLFLHEVSLFHNLVKSAVSDVSTRHYQANSMPTVRLRMSPR
jgi:hypothetical protein